MSARRSHAGRLAIDRQARRMTFGREGVVVEGRSIVARNPGGAGIAAPRGVSRWLRTSAVAQGGENDLVIMGRWVAGLVVPHQPFGEGRRVAQAVAGLDRGEAELAAGCEGAVVAGRAVAG